ncbi:MULTISPECIES: Wzz/FepE/Etk N-terminal domain-containing protein [unclassified Pseudoalteromonas]|uniref:Wzz/FepE/Etk N-terminal domain-containing protein n=1 Tax=unclassified Pseudoalteromonas TaxID=194690 RepID=UPI000C0869FA|nr:MULTISPECIES: Wzz/FepE/Etk N-terminal domain-containing protein [unclassified Pseudoalteromonas]MDP2636853.1 Wzz/FepE/Etk N-terminal domain-containing protein [Pseudoalteromonas sp. 1_MG-2023]PHN88697.1 LPS O-antigen length regulator [Pseudoalteromonas sp. 3D05]
MLKTETINKEDSTQVQQITDDVIDPNELIQALLQKKILIVAVTLLFTFFAALYAINSPNIYKSEALLAPADSDKSAGGLGALAGQLGGLASMAGISIGDDGDESVKMAIEVLKSREFISEFIQKHNILPELMAVDSWNMIDNTLTYNEDDYLALEDKWIRDVDLPFKAKPSMQEAYKQFNKIMSVALAKDTGMVTVSIEHVSPYIAQKWVRLLVEDINAEMKSRDVLEAKRSTEFLNKQISETTVAGIRVILFKLIEEQAKTILFAEVRDEYIFKTIDKAIVPEEKFKPKRVLICILGSVLGLALSVMFVLMQYFSRNK